jgi:hypothetical protein
VLIGDKDCYSLKANQKGEDVTFIEPTNIYLLLTAVFLEQEAIKKNEQNISCLQRASSVE